MRNEDAMAIVEAIMTAGTPLGLIPCGLGARDTLRLEAAMPLYGLSLIHIYEAWKRDPTSRIKANDAIHANKKVISDIESRRSLFILP